MKLLGMRILSLVLLLAFCLQALPIMAADAGNGDWTLRDAENGFALTENGITSMLEGGISAGKSAAVYNTPLGSTQFEASFDLTWDSSNIQEGQPGYTGTFLTVGLVNSTTIAEPFDALAVNHSFRVTTNHFQAANGVSGVSAPSTGIVDFGGKTLKNMSGSNVSKVCLRLKNNVLTMYVQDGATQRGAISYTFVDGYFSKTRPLYLSLSVWGEDVAFSVDNVTISSSDEEEEVVETDWILRDISGGFDLTATDGITSVLDDGVASAGSTAVFKKALGGKNFSASFDLTWNAENPNEGETGYMSSFLSVYLTDALSTPAGSGGWLPHNSFRVTTNHLQAAEVVGTTPSAGIVDFAGKTLENMTSTGTSKVFVTVNNDVFSMYVQDGDQKRGVISYTFAPGTFTEDKLQYLGFSLWGTTYCTIENVQIVATDVGEAGWAVRDNAVGFDKTKYGITSMLDAGIAQNGSAAVWSKAVGADRFAASFDLTWDASNIQEGDAGYTGTFLYVFVTNSPALPGGEGEYKPASGFRVTTNHIQAADPMAGVSTPSAGIVDYGGMNLKNMSGSNVSKMFVELLDNVLYLYVLDGATKRGVISYTFAEGYFSENNMQYVGVSLYGDNVACSVSDLTVYDVCVDSFEHSYFYPCDAHCMNCGELTNPDAAHNVIHVEAKDATCYENGNIEYWYCDACGAAWLDEACTLNTNLMSVVTPMLDAVAMIGENKYASLADAFAAAKDGDTIILQSDIETDATYTVADGIAITLNMNGKTITATDKAGAKTNYELFYIRGEMTVIGNGTITLTATTDRNWDALSAIFHNRGGVLTIENGTFTHLGGSDMAYVVDNSGNSYGDAVLTINGGELKSSYIGIRNRMDTYKANGGGNGIPTIYVNGGSIEGYIAIWGQASSAGGKGEVYISNGTLISTGVSSSSGIAFGALYFDTDETATMITEITGGTFSSDVSAYCVDGYACMANEDGTYGVVAHEHNYVDGVCSGCGAKDGWVNGCYYVDGEAVKGLYRIDGDYYYFNTGSGKMMADKTIWVKADNGYGLAAGHYVLGTDGKLQVVKNGWLTNDKGQTFYYINDERVKGLYEIDGDYYYFNTGSGLLTVNKTIWVAKSNAYGLAAGNYELGADGKLVVPVLNGWVGNYYYVDGEAVKGVYEIDGVYYYFHHASGVLQTSKTVWIKADNACDLAAGNYELDANGVVLL